MTQKIDDKQIQAVQKVVGEVLYYARSVDITVLVSLSAITSEKSTTTEKKEAKFKQLLDYLETNPSAVILFHASYMILNIHLYESCLS